MGKALESIKKDYRHQIYEIKEQRNEMNRLYDRILSIWKGLEDKEKLVAEYENILEVLENEYQRKN